VFLPAEASTAIARGEWDGDIAMPERITPLGQQVAPNATAVRAGQ
jgi:hypothetical protein